MVSKKDKQHNDQKKKTDKTMTKRKRQTKQWPKEKDRRTDKTMTKRKRTKRQTTIYKTLHIKLKIG
jgi:hypothetical protein